MNYFVATSPTLSGVIRALLCGQVGRLTRVLLVGRLIQRMSTTMLQDNYSLQKSTADQWIVHREGQTGARL